MKIVIAILLFIGLLGCQPESFTHMVEFSYETNNHCGINDTPPITGKVKNVSTITIEKVTFRINSYSNNGEGCNSTILTVNQTIYPGEEIDFNASSIHVDVHNCPNVRMMVNSIN